MENAKKERGVVLDLLTSLRKSIPRGVRKKVPDAEKYLDIAIGIVKEYEDIKVSVEEHAKEMEEAIEILKKIKDVEIKRIREGENYLTGKEHEITMLLEKLSNMEARIHNIEKREKIVEEREKELNMREEALKEKDENLNTLIKSLQELLKQLDKRSQNLYVLLNKIEERGSNF